ncbi:microfibril-associated glycoprotein 4-like [Anoplophora glabripennis]|uniref:microfibril-associated glycoprotein 4-like n=1 Tax=Anoplophora glabripennis TaxID=217634 RepID=UPI0008750C26|nr:microfibril-associated glycoprotein 4-like [Anoplophora glabripennis]
MVTIRLTNIVIFLMLYSAMNIKECCSSPSLLNSPLAQLNFNQEDANGVRSTNMNINLAMDSVSSPLNLKSMIRDEIISVLRDFNKAANSSTVENLEESPIATRSLKDDYFATQLNDISTKFHDIQNTLKDIQAENKKSSACVEQENIHLREKNYTLGVHHGQSTKTLHNHTSYPKNCKDIQRNGNNATGIYEIFPKRAEAPFPVLCDMETREGGWTVIQKRFDGSQDFYLEWRDYKFGFGNLEGEFWLGLQNMHVLTDFEQTQLLVEVVDRSGVSAYAHYNSFAIGPEPEGYKLERLSGYSGDAGDSLIYHLGQKFSTKDLDFSNGAVPKFFGAWWYASSCQSNLNGKYINIDLPENYKYKGLHWDSYKGAPYSHSKSRMLIKPSN